MAFTKDESNPFSDWSSHINKSVYSIDGKRLGLLQKTSSNYMIISGGIINLSRYFVPKSMAESANKSGIKLSITTYEARTKYSYKKMKNFVSSLDLVPEDYIEHRRFFDRFTSLHYTINDNRNKLAATIAFTSGILFLLSGYKANLMIYHLVENEITIHVSGQFGVFVLFPIGVLALLSQLGGITVIIGAVLFAANRVNIGKFLVAIGTGQGLFTIALRILSEVWSGHLLLSNNYVTWLTSSAAGLGILFAVLSQSISKGKGDSVYSKIFRFLSRNDNS